MKRVIAILFLCSVCLGQSSGRKPILGEEIDWSHPLAQGLVGWWMMPEGSGTIVNDLSGNGASGVAVNSPVWWAGPNGPVLSFNSTAGQYVSMGDKKHLDGMAQLTLHTRFRVHANTPAGTYCVASKFNDSAAETATYALEYHIDADLNYYEIVFWAYLTNNTHFNFTTDWTQDPAHRGKWFTIDAVTDGTFAYIYRDGQLLVGPTARAGGIQTTATTFRVGAYHNDVQYFNGEIDHVSVYNRALSPTEIAQLYADPFGMVRREPVEYYVTTGEGPAPSYRRRVIIAAGPPLVPIGIIGCFIGLLCRERRRAA